MIFIGRQRRKVNIYYFLRTPKEVYRLLVCTLYTGDTTSGQKKIALFETISRHMVEDSTFRYLQYGLV